MGALVGGDAVDVNLNLSFLSSVIVLGIFVPIAWFAWDMRSILKSGQRKNQLSIDGRWRELENYFERAEGTRRPFVWFHQKYLLPGNIETQYALFLYKRGRLEEALAKVEQAMQQIE